MRLYSVALSSLAIDAPTKWTDNLLVQHDIPGVMFSGHGRQRKISHHALMHIALIRSLNQELGLSVAQAVQTSARLLGETTITIGETTFRLDVEALHRRVEAKLIEALEQAPQPRRGRPPKT